MSNGVNNLYEFGSFRLDCDTRTLWRDSDVVSLSPKALELLTLLIEHRGEVVSKQDIFDSVWSDTFVEDGVLTQNIYTLRNTLGRDENGKQFIETIPRRGYRFAGGIKVLGVGDRVAANGKQAFAVEERGLSANFEDSSYSAGSRAQPAAANAIAPLVSSLGSTSQRHSSIRPMLLTGFGLFILAAAGFGIYQFAFRGGEEKSESQIAPIEQIRFQRLTDTGDVIHPTISPNGELLAFVRLEDEEATVWVQPIATGNAFQTLPPSRKGYSSLAFSSDGKYLFFREQADPGAIYQTSPFGGASKKIADNVWSDFSVSPDDKQVAFIRRDTTRDAHVLILSNIDGSGERELSVRRTPQGYNDGSPAWSPDGTALIVFTSSQQQARPVLLNVDVSTGNETELQTPHWYSATRCLWMPDGKRLIVAARAVGEATSQIWLLSYPEGEVRRLTNDLEAYFWISLSADGQKLVTRQQRLISHLWLLNGGDLRKARQVTFGERNIDGFRGLAWTPDGKIVYAALEGHITNLYSLDPESDNPTQLTTDVDNTWPAGSADGRYIVFTSHRTRSRQIWRMDFDGSDQKQLTFGEEPKENAYSAALSPDGREVFFLKIGVGPSSIWKVSIDGGDAVQVSRLANAAAEDFLSVSPDGKWLAYRHVSAQTDADSESRTMQIGVLPTDGNSEPQLFDLPMRRPIIQWSADSTAFYYDAGTFNASSIWRQPLAGEPEKILDFPDRVFNFAWSSDGKDLVVSRGKLQGDAILVTNLP